MGVLPVRGGRCCCDGPSTTAPPACPGRSRATGTWDGRRPGVDAPAVTRCQPTSWEAQKSARASTLVSELSVKKPSTPRSYSRRAQPIASP